MTEGIGFILLLVFGFILIAACAAQPSAAQNEDAEKAKLDLMINRNFEDELVRKIADPTYKTEILNMIKDDLEYVYGKEWKTLFDRPWLTAKPYTVMFNSVENIVLFLLLSKSGLIPHCYKYGGIKISNFDVANSYECLKILHCVERNIRAKHIGDEYRLIFNPLITRDRYGKHPSPEKARYEYPCSGDFHWAFQSFYMNFPYVIKDIHNPSLVANCKNCSAGPRSDKVRNNPYKDKLTI